MSEKGNTKWQEELLSAIIDIDREQAPHGVYGVRHELSPNKTPLSFAKLFAGHLPAVNIPSRFGWKHARARANELSFQLPDLRDVCIAIETIATIKVRKFGDVYRIDHHHGKRAAKADDEPSISIKRLSRLGRSSFDIDCLLLIAHAAHDDEFEVLLGEAASEDFLRHHNLSLHQRLWKDIHGRNFFSGLFLWSNEEGSRGLKKYLNRKASKR